MLRPCLVLVICMRPSCDYDSFPSQGLSSASVRDAGAFFPSPSSIMNAKRFWVKEFLLSFEQLSGKAFIPLLLLKLAHEVLTLTCEREYLSPTYSKRLGLREGSFTGRIFEKSRRAVRFICSKLLSCLGSKGELGRKLCFEWLQAKSCQQCLLFPLRRSTGERWLVFTS